MKHLKKNIVPVSEIQEDDILYDVSDPIKAQKKAQELLGKNTILFKSTRKNKKYMIFDKDQNKFIHFGDSRYEDYLKHNDEKRRNRYLTRALNINGNWSESFYSPNSLSIHILW